MWYMPATNELTAFWNVWNADRTGFGNKLKAAGYGDIWVDCSYWSSTENNSQLAYLIWMNVGAIIDRDFSKEYNHWAFSVRAFAKF